MVTFAFANYYFRLISCSFSGGIKRHTVLSHHYEFCFLVKRGSLK
jgi:hypothetical protein